VALLAAAAAVASSSSSGTGSSSEGLSDVLAQLHWFSAQTDPPSIGQSLKMREFLPYHTWNLNIHGIMNLKENTNFQVLNVKRRYNI